MEKYYYCKECKRVFTSSTQYQYCHSSAVKELVKKAPVNIIGSKLKGYIFKTNQKELEVLLIDASNKKYIKGFEPEKLKKLL